MMEKLIYAPLEAARMVGAGVLWVTEQLVPPKPSVETRAASITIYPAREEQPDEAA